MHKTTVEIDEKLLSQAMEISGAKTKKKAIEIGLKELIKSIKELGTYDIDLSSEELEKIRKDE